MFLSKALSGGSTFDKKLDKFELYGDVTYICIN